MPGQVVSKKSLEWTEAIVSIVKTQAKGRPIESPFEKSGNIAEQVNKSDRNALLVLDTDGTCPAIPLTAIAQASGRDFLLGEEDSQENRLIFKACGLHVFVLEGCERLFATNFEPTNVSSLNKVFTPETSLEFPGFSTIQEMVKGVGEEKEEFDLEGVSDGVTIVHSELLSKSESEPEERIVFGVVYEPGVEDAHGHFIKAEGIRKMAHSYMENSGVLGHQHSKQVNGLVKVLESYITPFEGDINGRAIKKGTWLMTVRVLDDNLWKDVKSGAITGFSFGGSGVLVPREEAAE